MSCHSNTQSPPSSSPSPANGVARGVSLPRFIKPQLGSVSKSSLIALPNRLQKPAAFPVCMNTLYGTTTMCCACEPRLAALKMPKVSHRPQPTGPQYFTFDPLPEMETSPVYKRSSRTTRIKKRSRRVLYPPVVKRYYPTEERSFAKRLLFILLAIVFFQIYSAEEDVSLAVASPGAEVGLLTPSEAEARESHCGSFPLEHPGTTPRPLELEGAANATGWPWGSQESFASTIVDITQFLLQNQTAF